MALLPKALLLIIALTYILPTSGHTDDGYPCNHDDTDHNPEFADIEEDNLALHQEGRTLASYPNMRIYPYYEFVKQTASSSYLSYIQNDLVPPVVAYFESALRVKYPVSGKLTLGSSVSKICERSTPSVLKSGVEADFFYYIDTKSENSNNIALSKYCYLASGSKRPIVARIMINRNMMPATKDPVVHEKNMMVMMHETLHIMGFSTYLYDYFLDSNGKTRKGHIKSSSIAGKTRKVLNLPELTDRLRKFHGCKDLAGAIMENNGDSATASSHFERKYFVFETMSSGSLVGSKISEFSLALLEGSGWYIPDYTYADNYFFGQGQGCNFISGTCSSSTAKFDEYCTGSSRGCSHTGEGGGYCKSDSLSDGCRFYYPHEDYDCGNPDAADYARMSDIQVFGRGAGSKCFSGDLNTRQSSNGVSSFCFKYTCSGSGSSTKVEVKVGSKSVTCTQEGKKTVDGYYGSINCPDPLTFCSTVGKSVCPRNCMGRGTCVSNKCKCKSGYAGIDCGLRS